MDHKSKDIFPYELYELKLTHYVSDDQGNRCKIEEPFVFNYMLQIGMPYDKNYIIHRLCQELSKRVLESEDKE